MCIQATTPPSSLAGRQQALVEAADLGALGTSSVGGIMIQDWSGAAQPALFVDEIEFGNAPGTTPAPTPTPTPTPMPTPSVTPTPTPSPTPTATPSASPNATASPTPSPSSTSLVVYADALTTGWQDWSWNSTVSLNATAQVFSGSRSISLRVTKAWGGLHLHRTTALNTAPYTTLHFAARATQNGQRYSVRLMDMQGTPIGSEVLLANAGGDPVNSSWKEYAVSVSSLGALNRNIGGSMIADAEGNAQPLLYVDEISFTSGVSPTLTPTPMTTPRATATPTAVPTATPRATVVPTATPTATPQPTVVPTATPRATVAPTATSRPSGTPTPTPTPSQSFTVYGDALASGWQSWSFGSTVSLAATSPVHSGSKSISFRVTSSGGSLVLYSTSDFSTAPHSALRFAARASEAGQRYTVQLYSDNSQPLGGEVSLAAYGGDLQAGTWEVYTIPFSALGGVNKTLGGIVFQDALGRAQAPLYLDEVSFTSSSSALHLSPPAREWRMIAAILPARTFASAAARPSPRRRRVPDRV